jgi:hypothetical protein
MKNKFKTRYAVTHGIFSFKDIDLIRNLRSFRLRYLFFGIALCLIPTGCATFGNQASYTPKNTGAAPFPNDPEANGDPLKAWYN